MTRLSAVLVLAFAVGACSSSGSETYSSEDVGKVLSTAEGTVVTSREIEIDGKNSAVGSVAGGALGGATAFGLSGGSGALAVIGAVAGAGVGYLVENATNDGKGVEYVVQMDDGRTVTLVQNKAENEEPIADGQPVLIQYGDSYTRVIAMPQKLDSAAPPPGGWVNPDSLPPGKRPAGSTLDSAPPGAGGSGGTGGAGAPASTTY